jgi:hypothetical protein
LRYQVQLSLKTRKIQNRFFKILMSGINWTK